MMKIKPNSLAVLSILFAASAAFADSYSCDVPKDSSGQSLQGQPVYIVDTTDLSGGPAPFVLFLTGNGAHQIGTMTMNAQGNVGKLGNITFSEDFGSGAPTITVIEDRVVYTASCQFIQE